MSASPTLAIVPKRILNADGTCTISLRITLNRKSKYLTLFKIEPKFFIDDKVNPRVRKSHKDAIYLNNQIEKAKLNYLNRIRTLKEEELEFELTDILDYKGSRKKLVFHINDHIEFLNEQDKFKASRKYKNLLDKVLEFDPNVNVNKVGKKWMDRFKVHLKNKDSIKSDQTVSRYLKFTKTILNNAFRENIKVDNSGLKYRISIPKVIKPKLSREEIKKFASYEDDKYRLIRDTFMMQFYLRGTRIGDVLSLTTKNIRNGRIEIEEQKTRKKKSIPISEELKEIIIRYQGNSKLGFLLPWMEIERTDTNKYGFDKRIESKTSQINRGLKVIAEKVGITKNVTTHIARHSFAYLCLKSRVDLESISKLLNHGDLSTTQTYLNSLVNQDELDKVSLEVYSF